MEGFDEILEGLYALHLPSDIVNLRAKRHDGKIANLYFDGDLPRLANIAFEISESGLYQAVWATLNPLKYGRPATGGAKDYDVSSRRWFPIDVDPIRQVDEAVRTDVPASDDECRHAENLCLEVAAFLAARGWPEPVRAFGGNSYHLLYGIQQPADSSLVPCALGALAVKFQNSAAVLDRSNGNASRVWKIYGTESRKGQESPPRPYRKSRIISVPTGYATVTTERLSAILKELSGLSFIEDEPRDFVPLSQAEWDQALTETATLVDAWFDNIRGPKEYRGSQGDPGLVWEFTCPWVADHARDRWKAFVVLFRDGRHLSGCHGNRCRGSHQWDDLINAAMEKA